MCESSDVDKLIVEGFGSSMVKSDALDRSCVWCARWLKVVRLYGRVYAIPGGAIGKKYVGLLSEEVMHVAVGNYPSDRLIVFSAVMLQREKSVRKGKDIRRVLERRMDLWKRSEYDLLLQEAIRCDQSLKSLQKQDFDSDHVVKIFTRLMLQGKVNSAVRWLSEKARGGVLNPNDLLSEDSTELVLDVLRKKSCSKLTAVEL